MIRNEEAEQSVLGMLFMEGDLMERVKLKAEHFYTKKHVLIFCAMVNVFERKEPLTIVSVTTDLGDTIDEIGGVTYLTSLADAIPTLATFDHHQRLVLDAYRNRKTAELTFSFAQYPSVEKLKPLLAELERYLVMEEEKGEDASTYDVLMEITEEMVTADESALNGYSTGFSELDQMTGGAQRGDLIILAGRPSIGKTAFALNLAANHCRNGGSVHLFSLEMGVKALLQRFISSEAAIDGQKWKSLMFSKQDYKQALGVVGEIAGWKLNIHESGRTVHDIRAKVKQEIRKGADEDRPPLIIIDYLQLMHTVGRYERRDLEIGSITRELKLLARELNAPIVLLSQLSRGVEQRKDKRPIMSDLRESGNIEQDADVIGFLYREDYYNWQTEEKDRVELLLSKQRNGPVGSVGLLFLKEYGRFVDV